MKKCGSRGHVGKGEKNASRVFRYIEANPIVDIAKEGRGMGDVLPYGWGGNLQRLGECGILVETSERRRSRIFAYEAYLDILRKGT